ncbi:MAG: RNA methyltransferase [Pirellulaceae bacterium]|nr:RNA methyltransferase [Pirellulaceae bacterium]
MPQIQIENLDDPRLEPYRHLRTRNLTRFSGRFIAESHLLVERLLRSKYAIESILIERGNQAVLKSRVPDETPVYLISSTQIRELLGFDFHRGVLACGRRQPLLNIDRFHSGEELPSNWTGVMMIGVQDPENMGLIARTCSALGIHDLFIGPNCVDPFARRVLRVSMAGLLNLELYEIPKVIDALEELSKRGVRCIATSLDERSIPLEKYKRHGPTLILLGNEAKGLPANVQSHADELLRIDMCLGTDSLNVSIAAGIFLHYLTRIA